MYSYNTPFTLLVVTMERVIWTSLPLFYREAWDQMPFESSSDAQLFADIFVSRARYLLTRLETPDISVGLKVLRAQIVR